jgi:hypothetical protein
MDGIRKNAKKVFKAQQGSRWFNVHTVQCIRICKYLSDNDAQVQHPVYDVYCDPAAPADGCLGRVLEWAAKHPLNEKGEPPHSILKLVMIDQDDNLNLGIHQATFQDLFQRFQLDWYIWYLMARRVDGFYDPEKSTPTLHQPGFGEISSSYYLHVRNSHMILWSHGRMYDPPCQITRAMVIARPDVLSKIREQLDVYKNFVGHRLMPLLACSAQLLHHVDASITTELDAISKVEAQTGFYEEGRSDEAEKAGTMASNDDLGDHLRSMSRSSVKLSLYRNHIALVQTMTEYIEENSAIAMPQQTSRPTENLEKDSVTRAPQETTRKSSHADVAVSNALQIKEAARLFHQTSKMTLCQVEYLCLRADIQQKVVCFLRITIQV